MKYIILLSMIFVYGCGDPYPKVPGIKTVIIHDTITVNSIDRTATTKTIEKLLNDYYQAGYMDATNNLIDLHNAEKFDQQHLDKTRWAAWKKMEVQINNKGK